MKRLSNQVLRAFALVVTDRRWAAPLTATALGFGLFIGVAIGPSASGTMAGAPPILAFVEPEGEEGEGETEGAAASGGGALGATAGGGGGGEGEGALGALPAPAPLVSEPAFEPAPPAEEEAPAPPPKARGGGKEATQEEETTELKGVVASANEAAGSYALAVKGGELVPVHARELPAPGAKLTVAGARLANGSFAEGEKPKRSGRAAAVSFRGAVTFVDPDPAAPAYTVSGRGASLLVHVPPDPTGAVPTLPVVGAYVTITAGFEKRPALVVDPAVPPPPPLDVLVQRQVEIEAGEAATYLDLAGVVTQVLPEAAQLLLSADGAGKSEKDLTLTVPPQIKLAKLKVGDSYLATATVNPDGTLTLAGIASDEQIKGADDPTTAQGDLKR